MITLVILLAFLWLLKNCRIIRYKNSSLARISAKWEGSPSWKNLKEVKILKCPKKTLLTCAMIMRKPNWNFLKQNVELLKGRNFVWDLGDTYIPHHFHLRIFDHGEAHGCLSIWVPIHYDIASKEWVEDVSNMPVKNISWSRNYPINEELQKCANLDMETRGLTNGRCDTKMCH